MGARTIGYYLLVGLRSRTGRFLVVSGQHVIDTVHLDLDRPIGHPKVELFLEEVKIVLEPLVIVSGLQILVDHGNQHGRLGSHSVVYPASVRDETDLIHEGDEIGQHSFHGGVHLREEQSFHDPIRVPVIKFAKSTSGDDDRMRHVNDRVEFLVHADVVLHLSPQHFPNTVQLGGEVSKIVVENSGEKLGPERPIDRIPILELGSFRVESLVDESLDLVPGWHLIVPIHEVSKQLQRLVRRMFHLHVDERFRVLVDRGHLYRVQQLASAVNVAASPTRTRTRTHSRRVYSKQSRFFPIRYLKKPR